MSEEISEDLLYGEIRPLPPSQEQISLEVWSLLLVVSRLSCGCIETSISSDRVKTIFSRLRQRIYT